MQHDYCYQFANHRLRRGVRLLDYSMTGSGRYLVAFYEHLPSRHWEEQDEWMEREELDFLSGSISEVDEIIEITERDEGDRWLSVIITDNVTGKDYNSVEDVLRDT